MVKDVQSHVVLQLVQQVLDSHRLRQLVSQECIVVIIVDVLQSFMLGDARKTDWSQRPEIIDLKMIHVSDSFDSRDSRKVLCHRKYRLGYGSFSGLPVFSSR